MAEQRRAAKSFLVRGLATGLVMGLSLTGAILGEVRDSPKEMEKVLGETKAEAGNWEELMEIPAAPAKEEALEGSTEKATEEGTEKSSEEAAEEESKESTQKGPEESSEKATEEESTEKTSQGETSQEETGESGWDGPVLSAMTGTVMGPSGKETYYNLDMSIILESMRQMGNTDEYWVREDGCKMLGDYIMCAANLERHPLGSLVESSLGTCIVCDTGGFASENPDMLDIATTW